MIFAGMVRRRLDVRGSDGARVMRVGRAYLLLGEKRELDVTPWDVQVDAVNKRVYVGAGYVNGYEPQLDGEPIGGVYADGSYVKERPYLSLQDGVSVVLLKITPTFSTTLGFILGEKGDDKRRMYLSSPENLSVYVGDIDEARVYNRDFLVQPLAIVVEGGKLAQLAMFSYFYNAKKEDFFSDNWIHELTADVGYSDEMKKQTIAKLAEEEG